MRINDYTQTVRTRIRMKTTDDFYSIITCYGVNDYGTATATVGIEGWSTAYLLKAENKHGA